MSPRVEIADHVGISLDEEALVALVGAVLRREDDSGGLSVAFVGVEEISDLNERYRGLEGPTDVLSFARTEDGDDGWPAEQGDEGDYLGDVVVCPQVAADNAAAHRVTLDEELHRLIVHGVLHLLGYDHEVDQGQMSALEEELLAGSEPRSLLLESR